MPPLYRIAEAALYSLLNFLPFMLLALYPFRKRLRFSKRVTLIFISALTVIQIGLGIWAAFYAGSNSGLVSAISTIIYALFFFLSVRADFGKTVFTLLMLSNISNFIIIASKCTEGILFPSLAPQSYRWSFSVAMFVIEAALLVPLYIYIKRVYTPAVENEPSGTVWRYLWLIPATFYIIWFYTLYFNTSYSSIEVAMRPANVLFFFFINLGACLIYYVVTRLILAQKKNMELLENNYQLTLRAVQYENLHENIDRARRAKHDVRHHITLMQEYLKNREYGELDAYLRQYNRGIPDDTLITFCENQAVNAVLLYYAQQAKDKNIDYIVKTVIPEQAGIDENDFTVLFGNLLENALHACAAEDNDNKKIVVCSETDEASLYITVDNTFTGTVKRNGDGKYYSVKHKGLGTGTESVRRIAEKYGGFYQSEQKDGLFLSSVRLMRG